MTARSFANRVLGGTAGLFALAALYAVWRGGVATGWRLALPCLVVAVLVGLLLRLDEEQRTGAALLVVFTVAAVWAGDALLALRPLAVTADEQRAEAARVAGVKQDPRTMVQMVSDLRRGGQDAWPAVYVGNHWQSRRLFRDTLYPLATISGVTTVMCREDDYVVYQSDERGFTNPPGQWRLPRADLALLGDSYVMGWCVRPQDSFAAAIRARQPATIVLGQGASGPLTQLAQMREFLAPLRPRHVLWFYYEENDLADLVAESGNPILARYLDPGFSQHLADRQAEVDQRLKTFATQAESVAVTRAADQAATRKTGWAHGIWSVLTLDHLRERIAFMRRPPPKPRACCDLAQFRRVAAAMQAESARWGGDLAMVYLPSERRMAGRSLRPAEQDGDSAVAIARSLGVPVLDLRATLGTAGPSRELYRYEDSHFTVRGHQAVAALVLDFLAHRDSSGSAATR